MEQRMADLEARLLVLESAASAGAKRHRARPAVRLQKDTDAVCAAVHDSAMFELFIEKEAADESLRKSWYVPFPLLELHYRQKWRDIQASSSPAPFTAEKYTSVFESAGLSVVCAVLWYENEHKKDMYVFGIRARRPLASPGAPFWQAGMSAR
jgi:hypothetical protein